MRVLVVGAGGREHALTWACRRSPEVTAILCAPGNGGTDELAENVPQVAATSADGVAQLALDREVDLVIVGPDAALEAGVADACRAVGVPVFGPSAAAARIETSKSYAKTLMQAASVPTAEWRTGTADDRAALLHFARELGGGCVVKADGLALGKGVIVCDDAGEAEGAIDSCLGARRFGTAGDTVVVEQRLQGREVSVFALCDGKQATLLPLATDYKRALDADLGPNTGGMGACSPPPGVDAEAIALWTQVQVILPILDVLHQRGTPFIGCLYVGLMLEADGPRVLEFNARLGDPETQALMPLLGTDFIATLDACARGSLAGGAVSCREGSAVCVVAAAAGYPDQPTLGMGITLPRQQDESSVIFHAGTKREGGHLVASGGRVLSVTGIGATTAAARAHAYSRLDDIGFDGMRYRRDIGVQSHA